MVGTKKYSGVGFIYHPLSSVNNYNKQCAQRSCNKLTVSNLSTTNTYLRPFYSAISVDNYLSFGDDLTVTGVKMRSGRGGGHDSTPG